MAITSENIQLAETVPEQDGPPVLTPKIDPKWRLGPRHAALVGLLAALYLLWNYFPLQSPELWGQVFYGQWILDHRELPPEDPAMPLADGMPVVDSAWLTQVVLAAVSSVGDQWLSVLFAGIMVATFLVLAGAYSWLSRASGVAILTALAVMAGSWMLYTGLQPQHLAGLCFALFLALLAWNERSEVPSAGELRQVPTAGWKAWLACFILFVMWTNLDGSFVWGLACLACFLCGRIIEAARSNGSLVSAFRGKSVRHWLILLEVAIVASLMNPYGLDLLLHVTWFSRNENLNELVQHRPLVLLASPGREFAISMVVLMIILRTSRTRMPVSHGLMLGLLAIATIVHQSKIGWYMMVFGYVAVGHFAEIWGRFAPSRQENSERAASENSGEMYGRPATTWIYTMLAGLAVWIAFSFSDVSRPILAGKARSPSQLYGQRAPLALTNYLRKNPPTEIAFSPVWWSDWLVLHGPEQFRPFITSHVDCVPRLVWRDYSRIETGETGWQRILDRYRINTVITDQERQRTLIRIMRTDPDWKQIYRDEQAIVFQRADDVKSVVPPSPLAASPWQ